MKILHLNKGEKMTMKPRIIGPVLRRWLLIGLKVGLAWSVFDFFVFFGVPSIREPVRGSLGLLMEPLLLGVPAGVAGVSLLAWALSFLWKDNSAE